MQEVYMPEQIASVYFDNCRDLNQPRPKTKTLRDCFNYFNDNHEKALSIASADKYMQSLGYHPDQVEVFRSYVDRAVINHLSALGPRGIQCSFDDNHYLGLRLDKQCFSLDPHAVKTMRRDFVGALTAAKPHNYKMLWTHSDDFRCRRAPSPDIEVA